MSKTIIVIHGRSNKPEQNILMDYIISSIHEGFEVNLKKEFQGATIDQAYYADISYDAPDLNDPEPYIPAQPGALKKYHTGLLDHLKVVAGTWLGNPIDWINDHSSVFSVAARKIISNFMQDLANYYTNHARRQAIQERLVNKLIQYRNTDIILVSHSMGTIVSYDVLRNIGSLEITERIKVPNFITMGSPLGLTPVKAEIIHARNERLRTPTVVSQSWTNFSDSRDYICLDSHIRDDYAKNSAGVQVEDVMVCNDYPGNHHKLYGYLRTPEFSELLDSLL